MASTQTLLLGPDTSRVRAGLDDLRARRVLARLWERDASLWSDDPSVQRTITKRLGWLGIGDVMARELDGLQRFAQDIRESGFTRGLLLGMGGSGLFAEVCRQTFGTAPGFLDLTVLDTTDAAAIRAQARRGKLQQLLAIISSKSGSTSEVSALSKYFYHAFQAMSRTPGRHCLAITDAGTSLETQANAWAFRRVFTHGPGTGAEVGGRFSALTFFGLVPAMLMGVRVDELLRRAEAMWERCGAARPLDDNPAAQLGVALGLLPQSGRDKMTLLCAPSLSSFGTWVEQLIAESTGKAGQGIVPIHGEPWHEPARYGSDRFFVELQLASERDAALEAHAQALALAHPVIRIRWEDRYDLGGEVAKWFLATAVAAVLLRINPFDEPNVKESKDRTKALLEAYARDGRLPASPAPFYAEAGIELYGRPVAGQPTSLRQGLAQFLQELRPNEYVALLSFLPRSAELDRAVGELRAALGDRLGRATMLGFGPRYLHSTGQLYKGGPDGGLFLFLTAEEPEDLPIPGEPFTFGVLKHAQALGDFEAMQQRGRRILRVHVRGDGGAALWRLASALDEAAAFLARQ